MSSEEVKNLLIKAIKTIQDKSGKEFTPLDEESIPRDTQLDFDSLKEVEALLHFCNLLFVEFKLKINFTTNIFYNKITGAKKIKDITDDILKIINRVL